MGLAWDCDQPGIPICLQAAESFFQRLKRERIRRKTYLDREETRRDIFNYIAMFYNPKRRHGYANDVSPVDFENQYFNRRQSA